MAERDGGRPATYRSTTIATGIRTAAQRTPDKIALREGERDAHIPAARSSGSIGSAPAPGTIWGSYPATG